MTATTTTPTQSANPDSQAEASQPTSHAPPAHAADSPDGFQAALEAEVARRIDAVERRWQSRKDRELNRARRRWESETSQAIDPELLSWIAQADPREVGQWLKAGLTDQSTTPDPAVAQTPQPDAPPGSDVTETASPAKDGTRSAPTDAAHAADASPAERQSDVPTDTEGAEQPATAPDVEREAEARDELAERRSQDPAPDLFPSRGAPADAFQQIEAGFARGEIDLDTYETARRRRGLT